jgi:hypothetical protein
MFHLSNAQYSSLTIWQQFPQQPVHLMMASWAQTCSVRIIFFNLHSGGCNQDPLDTAAT